MALTNAQVTEVVEQLSTDFKALLQALNANARMQGQGLIDAKMIISQLLYNPEPTQPITLAQINQNYRTIIGSGRSDQPANLRRLSYHLLPQGYHDQRDNSLVAGVADIQLRAIAEGFDAYAHRQQLEQEAQQQQRPAARATQTQSPRVVEVHHFHGGYYRDPFYDFYRDMWFYQMLFDNNHCHHHYPSQPAQPTQRRTEEEKDQVGWLGVMLALALVGGAVATLGYSVSQTYYRIDEMLHGEKTLDNTATLAVTAFAAWQGYLVGALIGASYFANPILGGLCSAIIASAAGMKAAKWGSELANANNTKSALTTDPRFCLSKIEKHELEQKGYNVNVIEEALRECAIMIKQQPANGLKFWHNPHGPLIDLMRSLKQGYPQQNLVLGDKVFELYTPYRQQPVEQAQDQQQPEPVKPSAPPLPTAELLVPQQPYADPVMGTVVPTYGEYPQLSQAMEGAPPSYQEIYGMA